VEPVPVPPAPTTPPLETVTPGWDDEEEPEPEEEEHEGEQPDGAPLVADAPPAGEGPLPDSSPVTCPVATTTVSSADELAQVLSSARPGDVIEMEDGTYAGEFVARTSGTEQDPIFLCGSQEAVLDGGDVEGGYAFHLDSAQHWRLVGFTVSGGQKGVMADRTVGTVIQGLSVRGTGDEAIHLRSHSTDNVVRGNTITDTGNRRDKYGEGVYIGSAVSNWCTYTECQADRSDRNVVVDNTITGVSSEAVDIKEGTTGGAVIGNVFDGSEMTGADSWVDVKGNNYLIADNVGENAPEDGFQTHQILPGWGDHNLFTGNTATVNGPGHAIAAWPEESNRITCDNEFSAAGEGLSNLECS
jgi:nitrous oxidase accessory protein NosD